MKIQRKRYVVMRKNRTEIWCGLARQFHFKPIDNIGETSVKTYRTEKQAKTCSSWDRDFEVVPVIETIEVVDEDNTEKQFYTQEDVENMTCEQLADDATWEKIKESMKKWN